MKKDTAEIVSVSDAPQLLPWLDNRSLLQPRAALPKRGPKHRRGAHRLDLGTRCSSESGRGLVHAATPTRGWAALRHFLLEHGVRTVHLQLGTRETRQRTDTRVGTQWLARLALRLGRRLGLGMLARRTARFLHVLLVTERTQSLAHAIAGFVTARALRLGCRAHVKAPRQ